MKILFMGTNEYSKSSLEELAKFNEIVGVVTKPDKPVGRGKSIAFSEVKRYCLENNIKLFQPNSLKEIINEIKALNPELLVVVSYGKIIPKEILDIPKFKSINLHPSLLPKYRGPSPIHYPILLGDKVTGVSIMYMNENLDEGDVILQQELEIKEDDNYLTLSEKLFNLGNDLLKEAINLIEKNRVNAWKQDSSKATYTKLIQREDSLINWNEEAFRIYNLIRAFNPIMPAYTFINGKELKIYNSKIYNKTYEENFKIGEVIEFTKEGPVIKAGKNSLIIIEAKPENKKLIKGIDLINGKYLKIGDVLGKNDS